MVTELRDYIGAAVPARLSADINAGAMSFSIDAIAGWPTGSNGPFLVAIDAGTSSEEKVWVESRSGNALTIADRGSDDTVAGSHAAGATVEHVLGANDIKQLNRHATDPTIDDHTQYLHITSARTVTAEHTFSGRQTFKRDGIGLSVKAAGDGTGIGLNVGASGNLGVLAVGAERDPVGAISTARATSASQVEQSAGSFFVFGNTSLTPGNTYTRSLVFKAVPGTGLSVVGGVYVGESEAALGYRGMRGKSIGTTAIEIVNSAGGNPSPYIDIAASDGGNVAARFNVNKATMTMGTSVDDTYMTGGMIGFSNIGIGPSGYPASGGYLYCEGGQLIWRGNGGTQTVVAPA